MQAKMRNRLVLSVGVCALAVGATATVVSGEGENGTVAVQVIPKRVVDTRLPGGDFGTIGAGEEVFLDLGDDVPADALAVSINVAVTDGTDPSFLTIWPGTEPRGETSAVNWNDPGARANEVVVKLGDDKTLGFFNRYGSVNAVVDLMAYHVPAPAGGGGQGDPGASAFEVAVENGFVGTEQEWLDSLEGPPGTAGADGADGADGVDGAVGADGVDGPVGADGPAGADGVDGASAFEVAVGNGFVGTEQEWLDSLEGPQGPAGVDGVSGYEVITTPYEAVIPNWPNVSVFDAECPAGKMATGGGFDVVPDGLFSLVDSKPIGLGTGWRVEILHAQQLDITVYAICLAV